ncbi:MAG: winged helix-turn-helix transcriptional regulator [Chloroflexi bacterium]|nr:winged helix-turn-helix transcriptional regulator [Chloroflexota bacterium]
MLTNQLVERNFYDWTQNLQGLLWQAAAAIKSRAPQPDQPAPAPPVIMQLRRGYAESPAWYMVQALEFDPEPLSVARLRVRAVYSGERIAAALLELLATEGWLDYQGDGDYVPTPAGRDVMERMRQRTGEWLGGLETELTDLGGLAILLGRVIASCMATEADGPWCLRYSRRRAPGDDAAAVLKINQYCADFNAFRDDAHMASYRPYGVSGQVWEIFWTIWQEQANTVDAIHEALVYRGLSRREVAQAVDELVTRGWVAAAENNDYTITEAGRAVRETAEQVTNERFYAPFVCLSETDLADLLERLARLQTELTQLAGA